MAQISAVKKYSVILLVRSWSQDNPSSDKQVGFRMNIANDIGYMERAKYFLLISRIKDIYMIVSSNDKF